MAEPMNTRVYTGTTENVFGKEGHTLINHPQGLGSLAINCDVAKPVTSDSSEEAIARYMIKYSQYGPADMDDAIKVTLANKRRTEAQENVGFTVEKDQNETPLNTVYVTRLHLQDLLFLPDKMTDYVRTDPVAAFKQLEELYGRTTGGMHRYQDIFHCVVKALGKALGREASKPYIDKLVAARKSALTLSEHYGGYYRPVPDASSAASISHAPQEIVASPR